jgi:hypothetical protein
LIRRELNVVAPHIHQFKIGSKLSRCDELIHVRSILWPFAKYRQTCSQSACRSAYSAGSDGRNTGSRSYSSCGRGRHAQTSTCPLSHFGRGTG